MARYVNACSHTLCMRGEKCVPTIEENDNMKKKLSARLKFISINVKSRG